MNSNQDLTIFEKILNGTIKVTPVYEDDYAFAFNDINPQAPVHVLVIPKTKKFVNISDAESYDDAVLLGHLLLAAKKVAQIKNIADTGYRLVINNGYNAGQTVLYLHCHVLGGRAMDWPPG